MNKLDNELISKQDAIDALNAADAVRGYGYTQVHGNIVDLKPRAILRDCSVCFGASFGDCDTCTKVKLTEPPRLGLDTDTYEDLLSDDLLAQVEIAKRGGQ